MMDESKDSQRPHLDAAELLALTERMRARAGEDPFGNPVLAASLAILQRIEQPGFAEEDLRGLIRQLRDQAITERGRRLAAYVGDPALSASLASYQALARRLIRPDPSDSPVRFRELKAQVEHPRFAAVFTAHPTFSLPAEVARALAEMASGHTVKASFTSHRPTPVTLEDEFTQAMRAIENGRAAIDRLNAALFEAARESWPDRWTELAPTPVILASWVGYDTDGRVDIQWWDTLRLRLRSKAFQLARVRDQIAHCASAGSLASRLDEADAAVTRQIAACPTGADDDAVLAFAHALVGGRDQALVTTEPLKALFAQAIAEAPAADKLTLCVAWAGLVGHALSAAHTHVRLNAAQVHNAVRLRLGLEDPPDDPFRRRVLLAAINEALDTVEPVPVDFGALLAEQASATRLMMTTAQIVKHIDGEAPIRFLIAETESGYTLLSALYLARLFGVDQKVEISPLFETAEALERGAYALDEALHSAHYRTYLRQTGRMAIQFGYSDSGRYVGQLAATFLIERLRLKISELLVRHDLRDVSLIFFDTHGESIGRGAHPGSLADRLKYLSPTTSRQALARAGLKWRDESSFQGGDGYLLFGTAELACATIARIAEQAFDVLPASTDPIYTEPDFAAGFFSSIAASMHDLVEDPGYAALLGAFGPALLDRTGSRPNARQSEGMGAPALIQHPRELRAIPNNAILQQLGWLANTLHGVGAAAARQPELFAEMRERSPRFRRAIDLATRASSHSDIHVLRAVVGLLDPGSWLDRATQAPDGEHVQPLLAVARALMRLGLWAPVQALFRRIQTDNVLLHAVWPDPPHMSNREMLLHALRIALIQRIWLMATQVPDFSPRHGVTRVELGQQLLRLDVPAGLAFLADVFPHASDPAAERDYGEPHGPRVTVSYARQHALLFDPMNRLFDLVREIGAALTHEVGAFG